jgi:hypothetical protein
MIAAPFGSRCRCENPDGEPSLLEAEIMRAAIPSARADYPTKPVRLIEPFGPGSGPEVVATAVGRKLARLWGQPVTVENHPGAGSTAAPAMVATSPADGHTLLVHTNAHAYGAALVTNLPYDPLTDFVAVAALTTQSYVLVAGETTGLATVGALIAAARAKPGQLRFGSTGVGTGTHLGIEKFNLAAGINATHVPARGSDTIAGRNRLRAVADPDHPAPYPREQTPAARPEQRSALKRPTRRSDARGGRRPRLPFPDLVRHLGAGRHSRRKTRWRTDEHDPARLHAVCAARERKRCPDHRSRRDQAAVARHRKRSRPALRRGPRRRAACAPRPWRWSRGARARARAQRAGRRRRLRRWRRRDRPPSAAS